jgi:hypothetical protein
VLAALAAHLDRAPAPSLAAAGRYTTTTSSRGFIPADPRCARWRQMRPPVALALTAVTGDRGGGGDPDRGG